jgi:hypothetical protein
MVARTTTYNYEQSSESGRERVIRVPYSRLVDVTPTLHDPAAVTSLLPGAEITGTILTLDATNSVAIINVADGAVYRHNVRNVLTYNPGVAELTWGLINIGDPVYYDSSASMPANCKLSTSPLNTGAAANTRFGHIVMLQDEVDAGTDFPRGSASAGVTDAFAVMQD